MIIAGVGTKAAVQAPPPSREQVEADWLLQEARRLAKPGPAVTRESDAAGAVDGIKNGQWGFHTE